MKHLFNIQKIKKPVLWTKDEDRRQLSLVSIHSRWWSSISKSFKDKTGQHCYLRFLSINPSTKKGIWELFEDQKIIEGLKFYGKQWSNRVAKQIRDRYIRTI
jgi:hypothetical protein